MINSISSLVMGFSLHNKKLVLCPFFSKLNLFAVKSTQNGFLDNLSNKWQACLGFKSFHYLFCSFSTFFSAITCIHHRIKSLKIFSSTIIAFYRPFSWFPLLVPINTRFLCSTWKALNSTILGWEVEKIISIFSILHFRRGKASENVCFPLRFEREKVCEKLKQKFVNERHCHQLSAVLHSDKTLDRKGLGNLV